MTETQRVTRPIGRLIATALHALWWAMSVGIIVVAKAVEGQDQRWYFVLGFGLLWVGLGVAICSALVALASRLDFLRWRPLARAVAGGGGALLGTIAYSVVLIPLMRASPQGTESLNEQVGAVVLVGQTFLGWVLAALLVAHMHRLGEAEHEVLRARAAATDIELRTLRQQVNSHLVFNALNSILVAIEEGAPQAGAMVLDLSRLLRQSLESPAHIGTLGEELSRVELFLRIEKSRLEDDLSVTLDIAPSLRDLPCVPLLLQPLVENATKHGVAPRGSPLRVEVTAEHREGRLIVRVTNDGALHHAGQAKADGGGLGLRATRYRLERAYGNAASLELVQASSPGGLRVSASVAWPVPTRPSGVKGVAS